MGKSNTLYSVIAGNRETGYHVVYETTKRSKADEYAHSLMKGSNDYDKVTINSKPISKFDKRRDWED